MVRPAQPPRQPAAVVASFMNVEVRMNFVPLSVGPSAVAPGSGLVTAVAPSRLPTWEGLGVKAG